jgi:hypothetical protein
MSDTTNAIKRYAVVDQPDGMIWSARAACSQGPRVLDSAVDDADLSELREEILGRMAASSGSHPSLNVGGWRTGEELFSWRSRAVRALESVVRQYVGGASYLAGWAVVNAHGSHHPRHRHAMSTVSGICYVDPGDPPVPTIFEISTRPGEEIHVMPALGRLVLFTGDTWHRVPTYDGSEPRITVAFDARR